MFRGFVNPYARFPSQKILFFLRRQKNKEERSSTQEEGKQFSGFVSEIYSIAPVRFQAKNSFGKLETSG